LKYGIHALDSEQREEKKGKAKVLEEDHKYNAFLFTSIYRSTEERPFNIGRLNEFLGRRPTSAAKRHPRLEDMDLGKILSRNKKRKITKVFSNLLPVGHFLTSNLESSNVVHAAVPKIYIPSADPASAESSKQSIDSQKMWVRAGEFALAPSRPEEEKENDILIGYYEKNPSGIDVKFKLRPPSHKITYHEDSRMIERGSACNTRHKDDLLDIIKKLKISDISQDSSIKEICSAIKLELMQREMAERKRWRHLSDAARKKEHRIKWFYLHCEKQPGD
jgi:hypothetical protein